MKHLKKEILTSIRGARSQLQLSRRLGYQFNQVYRWESGHTRIYWQEFVELCGACKFELKKALRESISFRGDPSRSDLLIQHLAGKQKISVLSRAVGVSRFVLSDWIKGKSDPTLDGVLRILKDRDYLDGFIAELPIPGTQKIKEKVVTKKAARQFFYENPIASAVLVCLDLVDYKKQGKQFIDFIAKKTGLSLVEVQETLERLAKLGVVERRDGYYIPVEHGWNTKGDFSGERSLRQFWIRKGLEKDMARTRMSDKSIYGFLVFPVSTKQREQVLEAYIQYANTVWNITRDQSVPPDQIMVMTSQLFGLDD